MDIDKIKYMHLFAYELIAQHLSNILYDILEERGLCLSSKEDLKKIGKGIVGPISITIASGLFRGCIEGELRNNKFKDLDNYDSTKLVANTIFCLFKEEYIIKTVKEAYVEVLDNKGRIK